MFKKTLVILCIAVSSLTSTIAQGELPLLQITDLSPQQLHYFDIPKPLEKKVSYQVGIILQKTYSQTHSDLGFQKGTCTDYASSQRPELFIRNGKRLITGNAKDWLSHAKELGIQTSMSPKKGSIAVYLPGDDGASSYGHVAYVEYVGDNGVIVISDMNYLGNNIVTKRTVSVKDAAGYID